MNEKEKRGVGRPSQGKVRRYFTLSADTAKAIDAMPAGERSRFVDQAIRKELEPEK
jgi:hypothetical protein